MIEIESLTRTYGEIRAVDGVSLTIDRGELMAIVGASGSGKTTLLRMINRMIEPSAGRVRINGTDTAQLPPHLLRRGIGYVIQGHGLFPHRTVAENIAVVPRLLGWKTARIADRVDELLELVQLDLATFRDRRPHELSGGQQQRVGVARALAARPDILLMDEPFGALDLLTRERAQADLQRIRLELGTTVVLITHDLAEATSLADRVAVMDRGRILQVATPETLMRRPVSDFVAALIGGTERPFRLLALCPVSKLREPGNAGGPPISATASLHAALSRCMWEGRAALPVEGGGIVTLAAIRAYAAGEAEA